jgi:hypothetical protein
MTFSASDTFWSPKDFQSAQKCRCKYHSDLLGRDIWVSTSWKREDEGLGSERYEVRATATDHYCQADHGGATDDRVITKNQWESAAPLVNWDFFPNI